VSASGKPIYETAVHEMGHALVYYVLGHPLVCVEVWAQEPSKGETKVEQFDPRTLTKDGHRAALLCALAGPIAEFVHRGVTAEEIASLKIVVRGEDRDLVDAAFHESVLAATEEARQYLRSRAQSLAFNLLQPNTEILREGATCLLDTAVEDGWHRLRGETVERCLDERNVTRRCAQQPLSNPDWACEFVTALPY